MSTRKPRTVKKPRKTATPRGEGDDRASFSEQDGVFVAREPELFRPGREAFCRRLANAAARREDVRSVRVCLASGTFRIEFEAGRATASEMASRFADAVREA